MSGHPPQRRQTNVGSILLTAQENESLFSNLGRKCITLSSGVVQVFTAERNGSWNKRCCGVACLVKDNPQRSYFIRVFDIREGRMTFEQELYTGFTDNLQRPYFITFAGDTCQVGLNFANEDESSRFHATLTDLTVKRNRRTEKRRDPPNGPALPMAVIDIKNPEIPNSHRFHNTQMNNFMHTSFPRRIKKEKVKRKRLTKADIGTPSNFQHVNHVGWNPNTGFDMNNLDPELKNLFDLAGISEAQLKDKETSKAIYDFIEKNGGVEAVKNELLPLRHPEVALPLHPHPNMAQLLHRRLHPGLCGGPRLLLPTPDLQSRHPHLHPRPDRVCQRRHRRPAEALSRLRPPQLTPPSQWPLLPHLLRLQLHPAMALLLHHRLPRLLAPLHHLPWRLTEEKASLRS